MDFLILLRHSVFFLKNNLMILRCKTCQLNRYIKKPMDVKEKLINCYNVHTCTSVP